MNIPWFYERQVRHSAVSGDITLTRTFGQWEMAVDGCGQSTRYTDAMWKDAYRRLRAHGRAHSGARVLMLGLGTGSGIAVARTSGWDGTIVAVEYDPAMVEVARELNLYDHTNVTPVVCDAQTGVALLDGTFNLIIVDLFNGPEPARFVADPAFIADVAGKLAADGVVLINVYKRPEYLAAAQAAFAHTDTWKFADNTMGAFWN